MIKIYKRVEVFGSNFFFQDIDIPMEDVGDHCKVQDIDVVFNPRSFPN